MKEEYQQFVSNQVEKIEPNSQQVMMMGGALVGFNVLLMVFVSLYWINPAIHQYISGSPL